ncbi:LytR/AlgR family response regulator transcription factor [Algoriphagus sediminis]|uniref:LytTR family DNA-binding domain-containing protein n=1 Tax=Algoriphagus sediminis TaxID=3057113 RepID=A0ABT7Y7S1_9BACT|nr:LytTR family DNA-binding domain-containing protein [Algoriphagus sediminis]MDN3202568.1 LytTR family DNA-binding domain-containing protein [Algoriphagus sediminis]
MKILLAEDEPLALKKIKIILERNFPHFEIFETVESVAEFEDAINSNDNYDLLLCDIHLADGLVFEALSRVSITCPIIFITAYDSYSLEAFNHFCLDYILKPIDEDRLIEAFSKYDRLRNDSSTPKVDTSVFEQILRNYTSKNYKKRFLAKFGSKFKFIPTEEISCFYSKDGITYLMKIGSTQKFIVDYNLNVLVEELLDPLKFYRINRSVIIHLDGLMEMRPYTNGRLSLTIDGPNLEDALVVAREKVSDFKNWINQ